MTYSQKLKMRQFQYKKGIRNRHNPLLPIFIIATIVLGYIIVSDYTDANQLLAISKAEAESSRVSQ